MIEVRWSERSKRDVAEILRFYDQRDADLAARMEQLILSAPELLSTHPLAGPSIGRGDYRKWPVRDLPLLLLYRFVEARIEIDRVVHQKQNWRKPH